MKQHIPFIVIAIATSSAFGQAPVEKDHADKMARGPDIFKKHVRPVLDRPVPEVPRRREDRGEFDLTDRDRLLKGGDHGPAFVPGEPKESLLYKLVGHEKKPSCRTRAEAPGRDDQAVRRLDRQRRPVRRSADRPQGRGGVDRRRSSSRRRGSSGRFSRCEAEPPTVRRTGVGEDAVDRFILAKLEAAGHRSRTRRRPSER